MPANGNPSARSSARPSSSFFAVVTMVMSIPRTCADLVVVDLGEDQLLGHPDRVVPVAVERSAVRPRKSRILGSAVDSSRSRNSHIRSPRSVTLAPMGIPSRSLNAGDRLAGPGHRGLLPGDGRPGPRPRRPAALASRMASPTPMFTTIFSSRGTCIGLAWPSSRCSRGRSSLAVAHLQPRRLGVLAFGFVACFAWPLLVRSMATVALASLAHARFTPSSIRWPTRVGLAAVLAHQHARSTGR